MKVILKSLLIIAIMAAFLEACVYFAPSENSNALKNKPASSSAASPFHSDHISYVKGNSKIDSQSVSSGNFNKWFFIKKKNAHT